VRTEKTPKYTFIGAWEQFWWNVFLPPSVTHVKVKAEHRFDGSKSIALTTQAAADPYY